MTPGMIANRNIKNSISIHQLKLVYLDFLYKKNWVETIAYLAHDLFSYLEIN